MLGCSQEALLNYLKIILENKSHPLIKKKKKAEKIAQNYSNRFLIYASEGGNHLEEDVRAHFSFRMLWSTRRNVIQIVDRSRPLPHAVYVHIGYE